MAAERARLLAAEGNTDGRDKALADADRILTEAVKAAGSRPRSHLYLLEGRLDRLLKDGPDDSMAARLIPLEPQYLELTRSFPTSAEVFGTMAKFYLLQAYYQGPGQRSAYLDKAVDAARKAMDLDKTKVDFVLALAELYYRRAILLDQGQDATTAVATAKRALDLPSLKETSGPRAYVHKSNQYGVHVFLAHCAIDQILDAEQGRIEQARAQWLGQAEQAVHQIEQIIGAGDDPEVVKWRGLLALAKGDTDRAVGQLYSVYQKGKVGNPNQCPIRGWPTCWAGCSWNLLNRARPSVVWQRPCEGGWVSTSLRRSWTTWSCWAGWRCGPTSRPRRTPTMWIGMRGSSVPILGVRPCGFGP